MENDVLRNKIAPWQEKGRWYHGKVDLTGTPAFITEQTDKFLLDNTVIGASTGDILVVGKTNKIHFIDTKFKLNNYTRASASANYFVLYYYADGREGSTIAPAGATTGTTEFWVFVVTD